jgi:hypothetical protein
MLTVPLTIFNYKYIIPIVQILRTRIILFRCWTYRFLFRLQCLVYIRYSPQKFPVWITCSMWQCIKKDLYIYLFHCDIIINIISKVLEYSFMIWIFFRIYIILTFVIKHCQRWLYKNEATLQPGSHQNDPESKAHQTPNPKPNNHYSCPIPQQWSMNTSKVCLKSLN